ncbi:hypothetical protein WJ0W_001574 [Paenibacillus melissococcoides]|uniref:DUF2642 domain-containing protein n=1 Tax=Paenibacillus melissococcoides TaxID=2912268 RepID=A0ABN8U3M9_9BACL|nr:MULTISPECIES: hypothetical protein [Paenibacillus]MEB9896582.1 hypothetical protein [Bacillus cereus]CAH8244336.1 hypothetical protein WJ0W_001574 [Paenibacillus melissococcoides]CAH8703411.1 hypothetical protein HTL2_000096 [Paenibacillus melissococcoides]CAH8705822.1 hypothetical protein WDD9_001056 [Paenibacillus melissococcoides]GIO77604.1 hypothetical protein J6TS7_12140 [Paenibacillus dendritiformis]
MKEKLRSLIGKQVQVASALDLITGILVSVDDMKLTVRTSRLTGYDNGQYAIFQLHMVSYVRVIS